MSRLMVLTSKDPEKIRLIRIPEDYEQHEAFRHVTGLIAGAECADGGCDWADVADALEEKGFEPVDFIVGPSLD